MDEKNEFVALSSRLEEHFNKKFDELPDELKPVVESHYLGLWDSRDAGVRRYVAEQYDVQHDPARDEEGNRGLIIGFYAIAGSWDFWAAKPTLIAEEAIPLMNGCDPESWRERARRPNGLPNDMIAAIERGLKIATGETVTHKSPAEWVAWGKVHGLDRPTIKSDGLLREPDVSMWPLFAGAVEEAVQAGRRSTGSKAPKKFSDAFERLLGEADKRFGLKGGQLDRNAMPGTKEQLRYVADKFEPESMTVAPQTFDDYIAGVVRFNKGRPASGAPNPYADLFPEYFAAGSQKN
jgi:hypothetical protein